MVKCVQNTSRIIIVIFVIFSLTTECGFAETQHKTKAATEKQHDLWCYRCDTMLNGEKCMDLRDNNTSLHHKCSRDQKKCQVRRISMSTSTEDVTGKPKLWLLQRNCTETCEAGCIVIGERTKLHYCIACCDESNLCNAGSTGNKKQIHNRLMTLYQLVYWFVFCQKYVV